MTNNGRTTTIAIRYTIIITYLLLLLLLRLSVHFLTAYRRPSKPHAGSVAVDSVAAVSCGCDSRHMKSDLKIQPECRQEFIEQVGLSVSQRNQQWWLIRLQVESPSVRFGGLSVLWLSLLLPPQ